MKAQLKVNIATPITASYRSLPHRRFVLGGESVVKVDEAVVHVHIVVEGLHEITGKSKLHTSPAGQILENKIAEQRTCSKEKKNPG